MSVNLDKLEANLRALKAEMSSYAAASATRKIDAVLEHTLPVAQRLRDRQIRNGA